MKTFYLLRMKDTTGISGKGVVAEGVVFDSGMCCMTWLTPHSTVTIFDNISTVNSLHGHGGDTRIIIEGHEKDHEVFLKCQEIARQYVSKKKYEKI